jgi:hypothetical protein
MDKKHFDFNLQGDEEGVVCGYASIFNIKDQHNDLISPGSFKKLFNNKDFVHTYTTCYNMCTQRTPYNWSEQLYSRHGDVSLIFIFKLLIYIYIYFISF